MCYLSTEDALVTSLIHELRDTLVLNAKRWIHRQIYALVCSHLIRNNAIAGSKFSKEMLPCLISLSVDKVPNVRLAVARTIATDVIGMGCKYTCVYSCRNIYYTGSVRHIQSILYICIFSGHFGHGSDGRSGKNTCKITLGR